MANLVAHVKKQLLSSCELIELPSEKTRLKASSGKASSEKAPSKKSLEKEGDFGLDFSVQALKRKGHTGLSARVSYYFPSRIPASLNDVFRYVDTLNPLLEYSNVFVVQDLDGDHSYYLRMDTVLTADINATNISILLDNVTQDVGILLQYFRYSIIDQPSNRAGKDNSLRRCG